MARLEIRLFGPPQIFHDGAGIHIERRKALALLAYLAVTGQPQSRETLAALLWPEEPAQAAHADLRRMLSLLRRQLGTETLAADREIIWLTSEVEINLDIGLFRSYLNCWRSHSHSLDEACLECVKSVSEAVLVYRGTFLSGFSLLDAPEFDSWQRFQSQALEDNLTSALDWLAEQHARLGQWGQAITSAHRRVILDPLDEPAQVRLMHYYAEAGQYSALRRQYKECERVLIAELGVSPKVETQRAYQALIDQQKYALKEKAAIPDTPAAQAALRHNLPAQSLPFIGREDLLLDLARFLDDPVCRLLTLIGPGGSGKTRLALEASQKHLSTFPQGVFLVSLASVPSMGMLPQTVAKAIGLSLSPASHGQGSDQAGQISQLIDYLRNKELLLILDGFEHILAGARLVSEILQATSKLKIITTSRARLGLVEEQLYPVAGMSLPHWGDPRAGVGSVDQAISYGAIRLFIAAAQRTRPDFALTEGNLAAVLRICRAVVGLPLGILLAAPWLRMLSPQEIAIQIDQDYSFLEAGLGDLPESQRSLRAVFMHSWKLLTKSEQEIFQGLSVFQGGFTLEAAHAVTGAGLRELSKLYDQSLVQREKDGRYYLHDLIRQFAAEQLVKSPQFDHAIHQRHFSYYTEFLEQRQAHFQDDDQGAILVGILGEIGNVRAAWNWASEHEKPENIEKLAELQLRIGDLARRFYTYEVAADTYRRVMKRFSEQGKPDQAARAAMKLGLACQIANDSKQASQAYEQAFTLWRQASSASSDAPLQPAPHPFRVAVWEVGGDKTIDFADQDFSITSINCEALTQLFSRLVINGPGLEVLPDVARSWEIREEGRKYIFHLREDVFWSDGMPVTAGDFEFAWKWALAPANGMPEASCFFDIRGAQAYHAGELSDSSQVGVSALDAHTLMVDLEQPVCYFLHILAYPMSNPLPRHVVLAHPSDWNNPDQMVTNGPFRLNGRQTDVSVKMRRNPTYHGSFSGNLEEVELYFLDSPDDLVAFENDQLDFLRLLPFVNFEPIRQKHLKEYLSFPALSTRILAFDPTQSPFDDQRVRQAFSLSFDREELVRWAIEGSALPAMGGFVPPGMPGHFDHIAPLYDPEKARQLLAEAGYPGGKGFPHVMVSIRTTQTQMETERYLHNQWQQQLGIDVSIETMKRQKYFTPGYKNNEEIANIPTIDLFGWAADYPDPDNFLRVAIYYVWKDFPSQNPVYYDLVDRARRTNAQAERMGLYYQAEKILSEQAVIIPLYYSRERFLLKPWVRRFPFTPMVDDFWKDVVIVPHD
jgi:ABC-type oligopeptide transport system substrate-binding subunit/predicted ATPase/DNA-binding SARP family transcriptional activator